METSIRADRGRASAPLAMAILGLLAACAPAMRGPAPVVYGGANPPPPAAAPASPAAPAPGLVVVQPGQSLSIIARTYHLRWPALAAANHLTPPYRVKPGQQLVIPGAGVYAATPPPAVAVATLPPPTAPRVVPSREAAVATSPEQPKPVATRPPPRMIPLDTPGSLGEAPARGTGPLAVAAAEAPPYAAHGRSPGQSFDRPIPLDNPIGAAARAEPAAPHTAAAERGDFLWPVRGPIVEGFGAGPDGTRNEGINIAASRNAPVRAADAGVVAYVGNELRGYGNLILIRHPQGWISAYAHCGAVLVKPGEKVRRGQIIARVGATGDVRTPQLHFELRRGKKAVDPRPLLGQSHAGIPATAGDGGRAPSG